jgi:DNA-binding beta-propeller fold protein YncE/plastocyanin
MQDGMSGMLHVLPKYTDDSLPPIGAVFTLSDEPGLWMKTLNAGFLDDLDNVLNSIQPLIPAKNGTGFAPSYLGALSPGFADTEGRSVAIIEPGETVLFNMKDSQTKHTITTLIYPTEAERIGGNGILRAAGIGHFDTQLGIRGSTFLTDFEGVPVGLDTPGLYVFVCKIHPYMFSAVVVDDKDTYAQATINEVLIEEFPLFDLSPNLEILTRHINDTDSDGILNITDGDEVTFPINVSPATPVPLALLKTFSVITDPSNWKDYTQDEWEVNLIPGVFTTNNNSTWVTLLQYDETIAIAEAIGLTPAPGEVLDNLITANLTSVVEITEEDREPPKQEGIGEIWVNTQFERTLNKNFDGTPNDKPGTITVVDTDKWKVERKIALPEINMNHPHNMWTDAKNEVVYQTQWFDKRMAVIDRESGELIHDRIVGESPSHVMTSPVDGKIYIAMNGEEQVTELDPTTYEITKQISTGFRSHPHGHWISSDGQYIVTPDFLGLRSTIIDLEDGTTVNPTLNPGVTLVENEHPLLGDFTGTPILLGPIATGMMSGEDTYYTADFLGNSLSVVDISDAEVTFQVDLLEVGAGLPIQTPVSPDDKWVVTANVLGPHGAAITVVDTSNQVIVATLDCDPGCHGVQWGAKEDGGYYAYVSNKFSNALIVVDPDPNGDGDGLDAKIAGKIILADEDRDYEIDDRVIGYDGMGGQGVLAIPNVYDGWIQNTVALCDIGNDKNKGNGPCGKEIKDYVKALDEDQKDPIP